MSVVPEVRCPVEPDLSNLFHDDQLWQEILDHNLDIVTQTFADRNPHYAGQAKDLEVECKRFMYLATVAPNLELAPTKPIDEYWHQFVLFTNQYEEFCAKFNGYFVHHNPLAGPDHETIFKRTQDMVVKLFGEFKNRALWFQSRPATSCKDFCSSPRLLVR